MALPYLRLVYWLSLTTDIQLLSTSFTSLTSPVQTRPLLSFAASCPGFLNFLRQHMFGINFQRMVSLSLFINICSHLSFIPNCSFPRAIFHFHLSYIRRMIHPPTYNLFTAPPLIFLPSAIASKNNRCPAARDTRYSRKQTWLKLA